MKVLWAIHWKSEEGMQSKYLICSQDRVRVSFGGGTSLKGVRYKTPEMLDAFWMELVIEFRGRNFLQVGWKVKPRKFVFIILEE